MRGGVAHNFKGVCSSAARGTCLRGNDVQLAVFTHMYLRFVTILYCALPPFFYFAHKIYSYKNTSRVLYSRLAFCTT
jgi:hypothetical protein